MRSPLAWFPVTILLAAVCIAQTTPRGVVFSTYLPGSLPTGAASVMTVGADGTIYVATQTRNANTTVNKVTVSALSANGQQILYTREFAVDNASGLAADSGGNLYIAGTGIDPKQYSGAQLATDGALDLGGTSMLAKLSPTGDILFVSYTGGTSANAVVLDAAGRPWIAGVAKTTTPTTADAFEPECPPTLANGSPTTDYPVAAGLLQRISADGSQLLYSSFLGSANDIFGIPTVPTALAMDASGNIYVAGQSDSFPLKNAMQWDGGAGFLAKFTPDARALVYSTYISGSKGPHTSAFGRAVSGMAVDAVGNVYLTGITLFDDFPYTGNLDTPLRICLDACAPAVYAAKIDAFGQKLLYSTAVGFSYNGVAGLAITSAGEAYLTAGGWGATPASSDAIEHQQQFAEGFFVAKLDAVGNIAAMWPFGGATTGSVIVDAADNITITGIANSYANSKIENYSSSPGVMSSLFPVVNAAVSEAEQNRQSTFVARISHTSAPLLGLVAHYPPYVFLRNMGSVPVNISSVTGISFQYLYNACPTTLAPDRECTIFVQVAPDVTGGLTVVSDAGTKTWAIKVNRPLPFDMLQIDNSFSFPVMMSGSSVTASTLVRSVARNPLPIYSVITSPNVTQTNDCLANMPIGGNCTITATLTAPPPGSYASNLTLSYGSNQQITANVFSLGVHDRPLLSSAIALAFPKQMLGYSAFPRTFSLTNVASSPVTVSSIAVTGKFTQQNDCSTLAPRQTCRVVVTFAPTTNEDVTGAVDVTYTGGTQHLDLTGQGRIKSDLSLSTIYLNYFGTIINTAYSQPLTLTNKGTVAVPISGFRFPPDYAQTNDCGSSLAAGASCTVTVTFTPSVLGDRVGQMFIDYAGDGSPQVVNLAGSGVTRLLLRPSHIDFGSQIVGTSSENGAVSLSSAAAKQVLPVTVTGVSVTGDFQVVTLNNLCPVNATFTLPAFTACGFGIAFKPTHTGALTGTVSVMASDSTVPSTMIVTGTGTTSGSNGSSAIQVVSPQDGSNVASPVHLVATVTTAGALSGFSAITDSSLLGASSQQSTLDSLLPLQPGPHTITLLADDSSGNQYLKTLKVNVITSVVPQSGWWWDPNLSGTGVFIEYGGKSRSGMFIGEFDYDTVGKARWLVSTGPLNGSIYDGSWLHDAGGQTLLGPYKAPIPPAPVGNFRLTFSDATHAVMTRSDGSTINLQRFSFSAAPTPALPVAGSPQSGWWWGGSALSGTGYGIEIQGSSIFAVAYVYDDAGNPVWYLATGGLASTTTYTGSWGIYANGPQLSNPEGNYLATLMGSATPMTLSFSDATHGTLTMGSVTIPLVRMQEF
jgi:hypothetical protein